MYNGAYNGNFQIVRPTLQPNYSIDRVIEKVYVIAGIGNELTHIAEKNVAKVVEQGEGTLDKFDVHFGNLSANVGVLIELSRERFYGIPLGVFYAFLICGLITIGLAIIYLLLFGTHHVLRRKYNNVPRQRII